MSAKENVYTLKPQSNAVVFLLQFVQYSDGDGKFRGGIIGNFYSHTSMMLYWGV